MKTGAVIRAASITETVKYLGVASCRKELIKVGDTATTLL